MTSRLGVMGRLASLTCLAVITAAVHADDFWRALIGGKPDLFVRYRYEQVDDGNPALKNAYANTLRTTLGYNTGLFHGFGAYLQMQDVRVLGDGKLFNDGGSNGVTHRAVIADPENTELHQYILRYRGLPKTTLMLGRQEITHRKAPFHRFVGNVLWRDNWQSYDGIRMVSDYLPATKVDYAYIWEVNRIFGEDNPKPDFAHFRLAGHLLDIHYTGFQYGSVEPYVYLLDFDSNVLSTRNLSSATYGARFQGAHALVTQAAKVLYAAEFAHQSDYGSNPFSIDNNYYLGELGISKAFSSSTIQSVTLKGDYEVLEGEGAVTNGALKGKGAFQTPLGTNHAFQGWADRFLVTPADGIVDIYGTLAVKVLGSKLVIVYHDLSSDHSDYAYGTEWDAMLTHTFKEHYTVGLKYAAYAADQNATNLARNKTGQQIYDLDKFWTWVEVKF